MTVSWWRRLTNRTREEKRGASPPKQGRRRVGARPWLEILERRNLLSASWVPQITGVIPTQTAGYSLRGVWGSGPNDIYAVGRNATAFSDPNDPTNLQPHDYGVIDHYDGNTWTVKTIDQLGPDAQLNQPLVGVAGSGPNDIYAVGGRFDSRTFVNDPVLHTTGGQTWSSATFPHQTLGNPPFAYEYSLNGVWVSGINDGGYHDVYVVGRNGRIDYSHDDGATWAGSYSTATFGGGLSSVWGSGLNDVYAVGSPGTILHSTDRGVNWTLQTVSTSGALLGVWGSGPNDVFVVGTPNGNVSGAIYHFDGVNWGAQTSVTQNRLISVWGSGHTDVYAVGSGGKILHSSNGQEYSGGLAIFF